MALDLRPLRAQLATMGVRGVAAVAVRNRLRRPVAAHARCRALVEERRALEIGGPSAVFARGGMLPVYPLLARVDNCDFAGETLWHGTAAEGTEFAFDPDREPGIRIVREATDLHGIPDAAYDVVLASHTIEHVADPLRALAEWKRVVGPEGLLVLVVPHLENTFDHRRPVTALAHLEDDLARATGEDDTTHVAEFVELCDLERVPEPLTRDEVARRAADQLATRTVHHHVFDTDLVARMLDRAGCRILVLEPVLPFHVVAVATAQSEPGDNAGLLSPSAAWRRTSVFRRDRSPAGVGDAVPQEPTSTRS